MLMFVIMPHPNSPRQFPTHTLTHAARPPAGATEHAAEPAAAAGGPHRGAHLLQVRARASMCVLLLVQNLCCVCVCMCTCAVTRRWQPLPHHTTPHHPPTPPTHPPTHASPTHPRLLPPPSHLTHPPHRSMREVVALCLQKEPAARPPARQLLEHRFFRHHARDRAYLVKHLLAGGAGAGGGGRGGAGGAGGGGVGRGVQTGVREEEDVGGRRGLRGAGVCMNKGAARSAVKGRVLACLCVAEVMFVTHC